MDNIQVSQNFTFPTTLSTLDSDHFDDSCPVCLDRDVRVIGSCGHATCWNCAKRWFQEEKKTCPYSRCKNWLPLLKLKQSSSFKPLKQFKIPKIINQQFTFSGTLYEYQNTAFNWMTSINKGILAFDMGLGKTPTTIKYISHISNQIRTAIIIMPVALLNQWYDSFLHFTDLTADNVVVYHGKTKDSYIYNPSHRIIITNFESLNDNTYLSNISKQMIDCIVVDEAHILRNSTTKKWKSIHDISTHMKFRWFLTGTPIHSSIKDFTSVATLANGSFIHPHMANQWKINHFYRKLKDDVDLVLPTKNIINHDLKITPDHRLEYNHIYADTRQFMLRNGEQRGFNFACVLAKITRLLQACNHPDMALSKELKEDGHSLSHITSIKIQCVKSIIYNMPQNDKIVIFSRWNGSLQLIKNSLSIQFPDIDIFQYDGSMNKNAKDNTLSQFKKQSGKSILLANTLAGGCGLNLVEANHLIMFEPSWTSATEQQAIDRVHRIGQTKPVHIHILRTTNTLEAWIHLLKQQKGKLAEAFDKDETFNIDKGLIKSIFNMFIRTEYLEEITQNEETDNDPLIENGQHGNDIENITKFQIPKTLFKLKKFKIQ
jgi:SNF2 family DNA or RNA helicase